MFLSIFGLLYGDYHDLHKRFLTSLYKQVGGVSDIEVNLWGNQVCSQTVELVGNLGFNCHFSSENVPKYIAMRNMFKKDIQARWVIWFDDDAHIVKPDWLLSVRYMLSPSADFHYFGEPWLWIWRPGELEFIQKASWYKGISPEKVRNVPGVTFAQGSYWGIRTDVLRAIDWPDPRLSHNGGDTKLGEAVRQNGYKFKAYSYGVKTNDSARRGLSEQPAGSI